MSCGPFEIAKPTPPRSPTGKWRYVGRGTALVDTTAAPDTIKAWRFNEASPSGTEVFKVVASDVYVDFETMLASAGREGPISARGDSSPLGSLIKAYLRNVPAPRGQTRSTAEPARYAVSQHLVHLNPSQ